MQPVRIHVVNELAALPVLQAALNAFVLTAGAGLAVARQMELVLEEIITNIIKFEYLPGQQEPIEVEFSTAQQQLELSIRFKGIPFDISYLHSCEQVSLTDILSGEARGIGLHLVQQFCDEVLYQNLGNQGQQIRILRRLAQPDQKPGEPDRPAPAQEQPAAPVQVFIRRMLPEESATVSKLAYFAYNYSYVYDHIYDPDLVRALNQDGHLLSYVAVCPEQNDIVGHCALIPDQRSGLDELGVAFVNPRYRGSGCLNELTEHLFEQITVRGSSGAFVMAVTGHTFSQKAAARFGLRETALLVSRVQPVAMQAIRDEAVSRESLLFMARLFDDRGRERYFAPEHHRTMLEQICTHLGVTVEFAATGTTAPLPEQGTLEQYSDHFQAGHIVVLSYGSDSLMQVRRNLRERCLDRLETIYLYLPLQQAGTAYLTEQFEELGFFFSGLQPGRSGNDLLVLQYLNNQRYDYPALKAATPFGQQLIDYVRTHDPNAMHEESP